MGQRFIIHIKTKY